MSLNGEESGSGRRRNPLGYFGIDFGTTNSTAVEVEDGLREQKYGDEAGRPLPSILLVDKITGKVKSGREVWENRERYLSLPDQFHVISSLKAELESPHPVKSIVGNWTKPKLVAEVLKHLANRVSSRHASLTRATFSVPVGMSPAARRLLRQAAHIAGVSVTAFVKESTAALMPHWHALQSCTYVAVFDWGGGTLDVSILKLGTDGIDERATRPLAKAGIHIDREFAEFVHQRIMKDRGVSKPFEGVSDADRDALIDYCERAKCALSEKAHGVFDLRYDGAGARFELTREDLNAVASPFVEQAIGTLSAAIEEAGISPERVDRILILGGSSKLQLLHETLEQDPRFRSKLQWPADPDWAVAHGAALLEQHPGCFALSETISLELSDADQFCLFGPGEVSPSVEQSVSLGIVDQRPEGASAHDARIIVNKCLPGQLTPRPLRRFTVPVQGFVEEEVRLTYQLTEDQTFRMTAHAPRTGRQPIVDETEKLRFSYRMEPTNVLKRTRTV